MKKPIKSPKIRRTCGQLKTSDFVKIYRKQPKTSYFDLFSAAFGRSEVIRTPDLLVPNQALYQAEPHPEMCFVFYRHFALRFSFSERFPSLLSKHSRTAPCQSRYSLFHRFARSPSSATGSGELAHFLLQLRLCLRKRCLLANHQVAATP